MADGIPTARGKTRWYAATIKAVVTSDNAVALGQQALLHVLGDLGHRHIDPLRQRSHGLGFPPNRGGFLYAAPGWMAAIFSYSTGGSKPAELCRRRRL